MKLAEKPVLIARCVARSLFSLPPSLPLLSLFSLSSSPRLFLPTMAARRPSLSSMGTATSPWSGDQQAQAQHYAGLLYSQGSQVVSASSLQQRMSQPGSLLADMSRTTSATSNLSNPLPTVCQVCQSHRCPPVKAAGTVAASTPPGSLHTPRSTAPFNAMLLCTPQRPQRTPSAF